MTSIDSFELSQFDPELFLIDYWQKKPCLIRNAFQDFEPLLESDELAGLACESQVESRIILGSETAKWQLKHGPFQEDSFATLPAREWTLLVQAVDLWIDGAETLLQKFNFLPRWQLDDLMVSYAVDGGSVGPHYDLYDVFLLQAEGARLWKIGETCNEESALLEQCEVKILEDFSSQHEYLLEPGDMLYLPPLISHWGIAQGECVTYSVGYRAPSKAALIDQIAHEMSLQGAGEERLNHRRSNSVQHANMIDDVSIKQAGTALAEVQCQNSLISRAMGALYTQPKYPHLIEVCEISLDRLKQLLASEEMQLQRNPLSRFCYSTVDSVTTLYADGEAIVCDLEFALNVSSKDMINRNLTLNNLSVTQALIEQGSIELFDSAEEL